MTPRRKVVAVASFDRRPDMIVARECGGALALAGIAQHRLSEGSTEYTLTLDCGHVVHRHRPIGSKAPQWAECEKC